MTSVAFTTARNRMTFLQCKFVGAPPRDGTLNDVVADTNHDMRHDIP
jgi:hypothetical protein